MTRLALAFLSVLLFSIAALPNAGAANAPLPRTIIALYDDRGGDVQTSYTHVMAEMPLNHLGLSLEYHDIHQPLPDIAGRPDVRGVIAWFFPDTAMDSQSYLKWAEGVIDAGKKFVVMGPLGIAEEGRNSASLAEINRFLAMIGIQYQGGWVEDPLDVTYDFLTPEMFLPQRPFEWTRPGYRNIRAIEEAQVHLAAHGNGGREDSDLIVTSPAGGYIAMGYIYRSNDRHDNEVNQWEINPFEFFRLAFATDDLPKPDTTTIAGRRIYYSHIDGDGWNNRTLVEEYRKDPVLSAQVVMDKLVKPFPDLPVTLTIISGDILPDEAAVKESRSVAREFLALPQVEAGTHTHSHPFYWQFFENYTPEMEIPYLSHYPTRTWTPKDGMAAPKKPAPIPQGYTVPRAYAFEPFDLQREIEGSLDELRPLLPKGKKLMLLTWSGNCSPWDGAVRATREAGLQNINGGDSRMDPEFPNYASLAPIGKPVGKERQIYASSSNENTYTSLWSENFHAHRYLQKTLHNSETPVRLKPLNVYYHIYAAERDPSLSAMQSNLEYARAQDIAPVTASHYTHIAEGFYSTQLAALTPDTWRVDKRGALQTIRFDRHSLSSVDFARSQGVVGQRYHQGSLYVYLDAAVAQPVIALKENQESYYTYPAETVPYLVESRWLVSGVQRSGDKLRFTAQGFGPGEMVWQVPKAGRYHVSVDGDAGQTVATDGRFLKLALQEDALQPVRVTITPAPSGETHA